MKDTILIFLLLTGGLLAAAPPAEAEALKFPYAAALMTDAQGNGLKTPQGAACAAGRIMVADTGNGRVLTYDIQAGMAQPRGEIRLTQLLSPTKLQTSAQGEIYALDERRHAVVRIRPDGAFDAVVSPEGLLAWSFALGAQDDLFLLDTIGGRVLVTGRDGKTLREISFPREYGFLIDIALDGDGTLYALDAVESRLFSAGKGDPSLKPLTQTLKEYLSFPGTLTIDRRGLIYVADRNSGSIVVLDREGRVQGRQFGGGWKEGLLRYPAQVCVMENGAVVVADRENNRVQVFSPGQ